jgi:hypothetical protein
MRDIVYMSSISLILLSPICTVSIYTMDREHIEITVDSSIDSESVPATTQEMKGQLQPFFPTVIIPIILDYNEVLCLMHEFKVSPKYKLSFADFEGQNLIIGNSKKQCMVPLTEKKDKKIISRKQPVSLETHLSVVRKEAAMRAYDGVIELPPFEHLPLGRLRTKPRKIKRDITAALDTEQHLLLGGQNGTLSSYDKKTGKKVLEHKAHDAPIVWLTIDEEGKRLVSVTESSAKVWHYRPYDHIQNKGDKEDKKAPERSLWTSFCFFCAALCGSAR